MLAQKATKSGLVGALRKTLVSSIKGVDLRGVADVTREVGYNSDLNKFLLTSCVRIY